MKRIDLRPNQILFGEAPGVPAPAALEAYYNVLQMEKRQGRMGAESSVHPALVLECTSVAVKRAVSEALEDSLLDSHQFKQHVGSYQYRGLSLPPWDEETCKADAPLYRSGVWSPSISQAMADQKGLSWSDFKVAYQRGDFAPYRHKYYEAPSNALSWIRSWLKTSESHVVTRQEFAGRKAPIQKDLDRMVNRRWAHDSLHSLRKALEHEKLYLLLDGRHRSLARIYTGQQTLPALLVQTNQNLQEVDALMKAGVITPTKTRWLAPRDPRPFAVAALDQFVHFSMSQNCQPHSFSDYAEWTLASGSVADRIARQASQ